MDVLGCAACRRRCRRYRSLFPSKRRRMSKQQMVLQALLLTAAAALVSSCDEKLSTIAGPTPNLTPNFATIQSEVFEKADSAGLNLTHDVAYDQLVNRPAQNKAGAVRVIPGDPDNSYVIQKLEGKPGIVGQRMPFNGGPFLTDGQML